MALLYPWATKEYMLWEMSLGQIIMYYNLGMEQKFGKSESGTPGSVANKSYSELKALREEMRALGLSTKQEAETKQAEQKRIFTEKYGDIG